MTGAFVFFKYFPSKTGCNTGILALPLLAYPKVRCVAVRLYARCFATLCVKN